MYGNEVLHQLTEAKFLCGCSIKDPSKEESSVNIIMIHIIKSPYNFSIQNRPKNSDRVQLRFQSPRRYIIKHLKHTKLYSIDFLRTEMTSYPSNYHREYSPHGSYSLFQFERSDVISVLKNSIEYSFVFCTYLIYSFVSQTSPGRTTGPKAIGLSLFGWLP